MYLGANPELEFFGIKQKLAEVSIKRDFINNCAIYFAQ